MIAAHEVWHPFAILHQHRFLVIKSDIRCGAEPLGFRFRPQPFVSVPVANQVIIQPHASEDQQAHCRIAWGNVKLPGGGKSVTENVLCAPTVAAC